MDVLEPMAADEVDVAARADEEVAADELEVEAELVAVDAAEEDEPDDDEPLEPLEAELPLPRKLALSLQVKPGPVAPVP